MKQTLEQEYRRHERLADNVTKAMRQQHREHALAALLLALALALLVSMLTGCKDDGHKAIEAANQERAAAQTRQLLYLKGINDGMEILKLVQHGAITNNTALNAEVERRWTNAKKELGVKD